MHSENFISSDEWNHLIKKLRSYGVQPRDSAWTFIFLLPQSEVFLHLCVVYSYNWFSSQPCKSQLLSRCVRFRSVRESRATQQPTLRRDCSAFQDPIWLPGHVLWSCKNSHADEEFRHSHFYDLPLVEQTERWPKYPRMA